MQDELPKVTKGLDCILTFLIHDNLMAEDGLYWYIRRTLLI